MTLVNWKKFYCDNFVLNGHLILELLKKQITLPIITQEIVYLNIFYILPVNKK
jgi:hypothetical protein